MAEVGDYRCWAEMIPDALGLIFTNLSLQEKLTVIPRVCKSWGKAIMGPYCWQVIDIEEWSNQSPAQLDQILQMLILRSCGSLRKLSVTRLRNDAIFSFIAQHARSLQELQLERCQMSDSIVVELAGRFSALTSLDLSYCTQIGTDALEAIGKHCKSLVVFCRNMHPIDIAGKISQDDEAHAIAATMPKLKHLEVAYLLINTESALEILTRCPYLELIDLRGCWNVKLDEKVLKEKFPSLNVLGPHVVDDYEKNYASSDSSYSDEYVGWEFVIGDMRDFDDDSSFDGIWDDERRLEELELSYYEENADGTLDWFAPP